MDDLREFKNAMEYFNLNINGCSGDPVLVAKIEAFYTMLGRAIENYEKRQERENSPTAVDFGEPLPGMLQKQVDF